MSDGQMNGNGFTADLKDWASHPFSVDMSLWHFFLLVGAFIVFALLWNILLAHLVAALEG